MHKRFLPVSTEAVSHRRSLPSIGCSESQRGLASLPLTADSMAARVFYRLGNVLDWHSA